MYYYDTITCEAEKQLDIGVALTPGAWGQHSTSVGTNAKLIAKVVIYW